MTSDLQRKSTSTWLTGQVGRQDLKSFVRDARDYSLLHGLVLRYPEFKNDNCVGHIPVTLIPSPMPKKLYEQCLSVQPSINELMFKIASDTEFIDSSLSEILKIDDFTRNLVNVRRSVLREGLSQPIISCINRSDYMMDKYLLNNGGESLRARQVEINAIASAMSSHSYNVKLMHEYLISKYRIRLDGKRGSYLAENKSLELVSSGLIEAFDFYSKPNAHILVITEEMSSNFSDHVHIELAIHKKRPDISCVRRRFIDLPDVARLGPNKELIIDGEKEIGVVYFRYGYDPSNYNFSSAWDCRLLLERSKSIKCPSIGFHISGVKKFQQILCDQTELERFLSAREAENMAKLFCKFWPLENSTSRGREGFEKGLSSPDNLVLKPQREGGGHNIFGAEIKPFLEKLGDSEERSQYILMEHIRGPLEKNWLLRFDDDPALDVSRIAEPEQLVSELGIFGSVIADIGGSIRSSRAAGYLVRSKKFGVNEGGVAHGYAGISSLMLIDDNESATPDGLATFFH